MGRMKELSMAGVASLFDQHYPQSPGFKEGTTSKDAAAAIAPSVRLMRDLVIAEFAAAGANGLTADEVASRLGRTIMSIRPRVSELHCSGVIVATGKRRANDSGLLAKVWRKNVVEGN